MTNAFMPLCALALTLSILTVSPAQAADEKPAVPAAGARFFELRKYTTNPGKLDALLARFRDHTNALFEKHGITLIGYWVPTDEKLSHNTLIYILAYPSKEARETAWKDFMSDPEWIKAKADSEKDGTLVTHVDSTYMTPTDFSAIK
ncbi:MAG TPA: NIPSNAP family protein [Tepidisphaeraceae bacterium]|jgi:hypothetical protein|nr:NIPSNAP family protein [Tepidisphaeraceae bacterium]